ncbi:MAG: phosphoglycerate kinase [Deltaproteobacteria bacterium]|nr:phosphoglycerate kinase [Deltaproteobacteria bacterium]
MGIDSRLPLMQDADLEGKVVLVRVDHNVIKKGAIKDPYRIDATLGTLYSIAERGGRIILMSHVGRPRDKKTGSIKTGGETSVRAIAEYLGRKLCTSFVVPDLEVDPQRGIVAIDDSVKRLVEDLRKRKIGGIYLPNTRWFEGEQDEAGARDLMSAQLAGLADVFVNDAFGSWQPHASTHHVTTRLPSFAGPLMQKEIENLGRVLEPERPFVAVIAGSKYDTKIGPLGEIYKKVDRLILGGVIYNAYLCAKYGIRVQGVDQADVDLAGRLVEIDRTEGKIVELPHVVESDSLSERLEGGYRTLSISDMSEGLECGYILDAAPESFEDEHVARALTFARTIFVNAVMGFTPMFREGSEALYKAVSDNDEAMKLLGGGDTLQEFKTLCPGRYMSALDDQRFYFFTGGGTVLKAIEQGSAYGLPTVAALIDNGGTPPLH